MLNWSILTTVNIILIPTTASNVMINNFIFIPCYLTL